MQKCIHHCSSFHRLANELSWTGPSSIWSWGPSGSLYYSAGNHTLQSSGNYTNEVPEPTIGCSSMCRDWSSPQNCLHYVPRDPHACKQWWNHLLAANSGLPQLLGAGEKGNIFWWGINYIQLNLGNVISQKTQIIVFILALCIPQIEVNIVIQHHNFATLFPSSLYVCLLAWFWMDGWKEERLEESQNKY